MSEEQLPIEGKENQDCELTLKDAANLNDHVSVKKFLEESRRENPEDDQFFLGENHKIFFKSIDEEHYETVEVFLEMGFSASNHGRFQHKDKMTPLHIASAKLNVKMMELLLEKGADINATNQAKESCLHYVIKNGDYKSDLQYGSNSEKEERCKECLKLLFGHKDLDINAQNSRGWTALHLAAIQRNDTYVTELIKR